MASVDSSQVIDNKVSCCSRRSINKIKDLIELEAHRVISQSADWTDDQIKACKDRFKEIFTGVLQNHINIDGENWSTNSDNELNATSEYEPVDVERKKYVNEVLLGSLNDTLIKTTRKRKTHPRLCKQHLVNHLDADFDYLRNVGVKPVESEGMHEAVTSTDWSVTTEQTRALSKTLKQLMSKMPDLQCRAERLQASAELSDAMSMTNTDRVIFNPDVSESKMAESLTPLVKRLRTVTKHTCEKPTTRRRSLRKKVSRNQFAT